ncbi:ester cyclase [Streptomyces kaniharaensis]|uniref:Ester cyclase n=1 Tax=Streptomyces kaniharaensis TaxID=212423 RepID=A0A6N7KXM9_9ACTN|nr:ester cyclase [Streptomyces kaniharaensis]MQS15545.1 ester cyclase [Streptomyces kaniharaensis]
MDSSRDGRALGPRELGPRILDDLWNRRDVGVIDRHFGSEVVTHLPLPGQPVIKGTPGLRKLAEDMFAALPDLAYRAVEVVAAGDKVLVRGELTGTQRGFLMGIPPTGRSTRLTEHVILRFDGDRVVEMWQQADYLSVLSQLGITPPEGAGPLGTVAHTFRTVGRLGGLAVRDRIRQRKAAAR